LTPANGDIGAGAEVGAEVAVAAVGAADVPLLLGLGVAPLPVFAPGEDFDGPAIFAGLGAPGELDAIPNPSSLLVARDMQAPPAPSRQAVAPMVQANFDFVVDRMGSPPFLLPTGPTANLASPNVEQSHFHLRFGSK
jgi:hypothetical protein